MDAPLPRYFKLTLADRERQEETARVPVGWPAGSFVCMPPA
jgi:hypothetical protein